ncbi:MAG: acetylglutamate kinase [Gammaproteobacteria bacterium]|nr:acetylglutamate kinase [Gammaproteobacteria bacterium]
MSDTKDIYHELLLQIGSSREVNQYLKVFSDVDSLRFAVIKVGGGVIQDNLPELSAAITFLHRLGLRPIILHGAGPQVDVALKNAKIDCEKVDNLRVTTEEVMSVARPIIYDINQQLVAMLESRGIRARSIQHGTFTASFLDKKRYGLVGEIDSVNTNTIKQAIAADAIPVLTCLGETSAGQVLNINADIATRELVWAIKPHKIIFLTPTGGLLDANERIIPAVSLDNDYETLINEPWVHSGMQLKLHQINEILQKLDVSSSVSITSAHNLSRELFTHRGAGTLIRKGEKISLYENPNNEIMQTVTEMIEAAFNKSLKSNWADTLKNPVILMSDSQRAAAVVVTGQDGIPYLDKFIVTPEGRGEGLGAAIWQCLSAHYPQFYWRSRNSNPITPWYFSKADTCERRNEWVIFTINITDKDIRARVVADALFRDAGWTTITDEGEV